MVFSGDDSRCVLGTLPHTLPCLSVGVIAAAAWSTAAATDGAAERDEVPNEQKKPHPLDEITMADESCFVAFALFIAMNAACRRLTGCLHSAPFEALRSFIQCDATIIMAAPSLTGFECDNTNDGKESDEDYDGLHRGADYLRVFVHESQEGLNAVPTIPGLAEPLAFALSPAVISAPCVEADPFTVEFTQQLSSGCAAIPALTLSHVSQRCLACDLMSVLSRPPPPVFCLCPIRDTLRCGGYLFAWTSTHVTMLNGCVFCLAGTRETSVCADTSAKFFVDGSRRN